ncbi:MAG: hypothetical protein U1A78_19055 [Polyangia bacterium]
MRGPLLGLCVLWLADPGTAFAQASPTPAQAGSAAAQTADPGKTSPQLMDAAKRHYDDAIQFFQQGNYEAARVEFEASFALSKAPDLLYNLSTTAEKQGQLADAIRYAERYLEAKPDAEDAARVRERITSLRAKQQPEAPVSPGPALTPPQPTLPVNPSPPIETAAELRSSGLPKPALGMLGAGVGLLLGGIGTGAAALATDKQVSGMEMIYFGDLQTLDQRGRALNTAAIVLSVTGGVATAAGASWLIAWKVRRR